MGPTTPASMPGAGRAATNARCPMYLPVAVGRSFYCRVTVRQGHHETAVVTIINRDSDFSVRVS